MAFKYRVEMIRSEVRENLSLAGRPDNFDLVGRGVLTEPEVEAQIVLRDIAAAATYFIELHEIAAGNADTSV